MINPSKFLIFVNNLGSQEDRFADQMRLALETAEGRAILSRFDLVPSDLGVHSIRKGSATSALAGSTAGPVHCCVMRRAGWKYPGSEDRYLQEGPGGDQYLGRLAAGLDVHSPDFVILPPHFAPADVSNDLLISFFPAFGGNEKLYGVLARCLASVVHHFDYLKSNLPQKHSFFSSPLFYSQDIFDELKKSVLFGLLSPHMRATGVPPHAAINRRLKDIENRIENLTPEITGGIEKMLHENGAAAANITPDRIESVMLNGLQLALAQILPQYGVVQQTGTAAEAAPASFFELYSWGGSFHKLPEGYKFPEVTLVVAFRLWFIGDKVEKIPPFKALEPTDFSDKNERKRLSDWKCIMKYLIESLGEDFVLNDRNKCNVDIISAQFKLANERMPRNEKKKRGRPEEWTIQTALKECRKAKKARVATEDDQSDE